MTSHPCLITSRPHASYAAWAPPANSSLRSCRVSGVGPSDGSSAVSSVDGVGEGLADRVAGDLRTAVLVISGAVAFVLLIACANVASLLLARGSTRQRELAIRSWLYRIAHNECVSMLRRRPPHPTQPLTGREVLPAQGVAERVETAEELRWLRQDLQALPDDQRGALVLRELAGLSHGQIAEVLELHRGMKKGPARERALDLLRMVGIPDPKRRLEAFPHEMSGGMAQRVMIAMAVACEPELLIADEATSALDAVVRHRILELIDEQVRLRGMGLVLISHDLDLVAGYADRVLVMYAGRVVEELQAGRMDAAVHPYTRGLLACRPSLDHPGGELPVLQREAAWLL